MMTALTVSIPSSTLDVLPVLKCCLLGIFLLLVPRVAGAEDEVSHLAIVWAEGTAEQQEATRAALIQHFAGEAMHIQEVESDGTLLEPAKLLREELRITWSETSVRASLSQADASKKWSWNSQGDLEVQARNIAIFVASELAGRQALVPPGAVPSKDSAPRSDSVPPAVDDRATSSDGWGTVEPREVVPPKVQKVPRHRPLHPALTYIGATITIALLVATGVSIWDLNKGGDGPSSVVLGTSALMVGVATTIGAVYYTDWGGEFYLGASKDGPTVTLRGSF